MRYAGSRPSHHGWVKDLTCSGHQVRINSAIVLGGGYTVTGRRQGNGDVKRGSSSMQRGDERGGVVWVNTTSPLSVLVTTFISVSG